MKIFFKSTLILILHLNSLSASPQKLSRDNREFCLAPLSVLKISADDVADLLEDIQKGYPEIAQLLIQDDQSLKRRHFLRGEIGRAIKENNSKILYKPSFTKVLFKDLVETFPYLEKNGLLKKLPRWRQLLSSYSLNFLPIIKMILAMPVRLNLLLTMGVIGTSIIFSPLAIFSSVAFWHILLVTAGSLLLVDVKNRLKMLKKMRGQADYLFVYLNRKNISEYQKDIKSPLILIKVMAHEIFHQTPGFKNYFVQEIFASVYVAILFKDAKPGDFTKLNDQAHMKGFELADRDWNDLKNKGKDIRSLLQQGSRYNNLSELAHFFKVRPEHFLSSNKAQEIYKMPLAIGGYLAGVYKKVKTATNNEYIAERLIKTLTQGYMDVIEAEAYSTNPSYTSTSAGEASA